VYYIVFVARVSFVYVENGKENKSRKI